MSLPEGDLDQNDSNIEAHEKIHAALNLLATGTSVAGDVLDVVALGTPNTLSVSAPQDVKSGQVQTVAHDSSGPIAFTLAAGTKAVVVEATAPITGATINAAAHGEIVDLPVLIKAVGSAVSIDLTGASFFGVEPPAVLAAGSSFPTRFVELAGDLGASLLFPSSTTYPSPTTFPS